MPARIATPELVKALEKEVFGTVDGIPRRHCPSGSRALRDRPAQDPFRQDAASFACRRWPKAAIRVT
jgi:hypothetical protein